MPVCPICQGTGKIEKPVNMQEKALFDCEECEGTGRVPGDTGEEIIDRLDRIIQLLEEMKK